MLNRLLAERGDPRRLIPRETARGELSAYVDATRQDQDVVGLVVTTPLKEAVLSFLDRRTTLVKLIGACNCVRFDAEGWLGANFDGFGFSSALHRSGIGLCGRRVLLKGCGGAGKAIAARMIAEGAAMIVIDDPLPGRASEFIAHLRANELACELYAGGDVSDELDLAVNASPVGMQPEDPSPLSDEEVSRCAAIVDIVVASGESALCRQARRLGKLFVGGAAVVEGQAELLLDFLLGHAPGEEAVVAKAGLSTAVGKTP